MAAEKSRLTLVNFNKADSPKGRHILIVESPESKRAVALKTSVFSIGRHPNNALMVVDKLVSRHHATIAWMKYKGRSGRIDYAYWIIDGKGKRQRSTNGILVNGEKKTLHRLKSGDVIGVGQNIKITYNYIAYTTETNGFIDYCDKQKTQYASKKKLNYEDTIYEDTIIKEYINQKNLIKD